MPPKMQKRRKMKQYWKMKFRQRITTIKISFAQVLIGRLQARNVHTNESLRERFNKGFMVLGL
jgi:hypothetical protein